jgi:hypothetical protein
LHAKHLRRRLEIAEDPLAEHLGADLVEVFGDPLESACGGFRSRARAQTGLTLLS